MSYLIKSDYFPASSEHPFVYFDSEKQFAINQRELGPDWRWHDSDFTYQINDHGYRMNKDLHEVDLSNYIAFFGCSYTLGSGLPLHDTFAYKIAQRANMDYVNAAVVGSSSDFVFYNFTKLVSTASSLPKIIVINWPGTIRTMYWYKNNIVDFLPSVVYNTDHPMTPDGIKFWSDSYKFHLLEPSNYTNRFEYIRQNIITLCKLAGIKFFEFTTEWSHTNSKIRNIPSMPKWESNRLRGKDLINFANEYFARDIMPKNYGMFDFLKLAPDLTGWAHPGISYQDRVVKEFFSKITI
jgi:hypothetical protein